MKTLRVIVSGLAVGVLIAAMVLAAWFTLSPVGRTHWNQWMGSIQKVDDSTKYETRKQVEDTCRAMISSYESDRLTYEQYKDSDNAEKQSWGEQAKMRANKTATTYNNYILENSFVWEDNVPDDIRDKLPYLE